MPTEANGVKHVVPYTFKVLIPIIQRGEART